MFRNFKGSLELERKSSGRFQLKPYRLNFPLRKTYKKNIKNRMLNIEATLHFSELERLGPFGEGGLKGGGPTPPPVARNNWVYLTITFSYYNNI